MAIIGGLTKDEYTIEKYEQTDNKWIVTTIYNPRGYRYRVEVRSQSKPSEEKIAEELLKTLIRTGVI